MVSADPGAGLQEHPIVPADGDVEYHGAVVQPHPVVVDPAEGLRGGVVEAGQPEGHRAVRPPPDGGAVRVAAGGVAQDHRHLRAAPGPAWCGSLNPTRTCWSATRTEC